MSAQDDLSEDIRGLGITVIDGPPVDLSGPLAQHLISAGWVKQSAAIEAVGALHKPEKRWEPYEGAGYTFLTREQALEAAGEEDLGVVAIEAGPQFFEVCAECARVESEQLSESGEEWGYREALWPCKTATAVAAALGSDTTNQEGTQ